MERTIKMNKIILMRHGISEGNERQIIQGKKNFGLSTAGIHQLHELDLDKFLDIKNIYSSNFKRAMETAKIVKDIIKYDGKISIDSVLREVSAGILDGKEKEYCKENLKEYYNIYLKRGDYNEIPMADKWQYSQARALIFLEKYLNNDECCDFVVTHAAFMRCIINMILFRDRNTPIELPNCKIYEFENPLKNIKFYKYDMAKTSTVYKIGCYDSDYVMKRKKGLITNKDINESIITNYLKDYFLVPEIISMENRDGYYIKIIKYLEGNHKFGQLNNNEIDLVTKQVYNMYSKLQEINLTSVEKKNIIFDLKNMKKNIIDEKSKKTLERLLRNEVFINYLDECQCRLIHNDLHRANILFDNNNINIIDYESIGLYPSIMQLASYISTCYLIEEEETNYNKILNAWPEKYNSDILKKFITYRLLYGLSFFDKKIISDNYDNSDIEIKKKYVKALRRIER